MKPSTSPELVSSEGRCVGPRLSELVYEGGETQARCAAVVSTAACRHRPPTRSRAEAMGGGHGLRGFGLDGRKPSDTVAWIEWVRRLDRGDVHRPDTGLGCLQSGSRPVRASQRGFGRSDDVGCSGPIRSFPATWMRGNTQPEAGGDADAIGRYQYGACSVEESFGRVGSDHAVTRPAADAAGEQREIAARGRSRQSNLGRISVRFV